MRGQTRGQVEAEISEAIIRFEKEFMGRGPTETNRRRRRDGVSGWANPYCWGVVEPESRHRVQTRGVGFFCAPTDGVREGFVMGRPAAPAAVFKVFQGQRQRLLAAQDRFGTCIAPEQFPREGK